MTTPVIELNEARRIYPTPQGELHALAGVSLTIQAGEVVAIVGRSGSGKSTLVNLIAGIDRPTSGTVRVGGSSVEGMTESARSRWRGRTVGIVFQFFQLLPTLTVRENVMLPIDFAGTLSPARAKDRATELLARVGIESQANKFPSALSGGQQQRAAIARALANDPPLLLADEPTGNLDSQTADKVLSLLSELGARGKTVVLVTHEREIARRADRVVSLADGQIAEITHREVARG